MSEVKHTPGPWEEQASFSNAVIFIVPKGATSDEAAIATILGGRKEQNANARLIAAAPDLLEVLRWVRANYAGGSTAEINARIEAVISKAEGRS